MAFLKQTLILVAVVSTLEARVAGEALLEKTESHPDSFPNPDRELQNNGSEGGDPRGGRRKRVTSNTAGGEINEEAKSVLKELNYRTTDEVFADLKAFKNKCSGYFRYATETDADTGRSLDYVIIEKPGASRWQFMTFGMHAREMITVKSAYHLVQSLCSGGGSVLDHTAFLIFPNVNPVSRRVVERTAQWDLRVNENKVDINRNFEWNWQSKGQGDTYPGTSAFSEYQSRILRDSWKKLLAEKKESQVQYVDVHSGKEEIVVPLGKDLHTDHPNLPNLLQIFEGLQNEHCQNCDIRGHLAKPFQSVVHGDGLDYFAQYVDYSVLFEIMNPDIKGYQKAFREKKSRREQSYPFFIKGDRDHTQVLNKWTPLYLAFAEKIFQKTGGNSGNSSGAATTTATTTTTTSGNSGNSSGAATTATTTTATTSGNSGNSSGAGNHCKDEWTRCDLLVTANRLYLCEDQNNGVAEKCQLTCKKCPAGSTMTSIQELKDPQKNSPDCESKPDGGQCRGFFKRYYFDKNSRTCKDFTHGGCDDGNGNNYESPEECEKQCGKLGGKPVRFPGPSTAK